MDDTVLGSKNDGQEINLDNLYSALVECFFVILCGFAAGRLNLISQRETKGLDVFVRTFSLPSVIFLSLAQLDMSIVNWRFLGSILISKTLVFSAVIIVALCLIRPIHLGKLGLYAIFCTQSNDFALGYPILNALYGKEHPNYPTYVYLLAPISLAILNPIAYVLLEIGKFYGNTTKSLEKIEASNIPRIEINGSNNQNLIEERNVLINDSSHNCHSFKLSTNKIKIETKFLKFVFMNVVTNPVMMMTVLGMVGNLFYHYIKFIGIVLSAFAQVFSTTALFLLGLKMVGTVHKLKGSAMVAPGILILSKLLVLPLVTREIISLLHVGSDANDTLSLSTFGFMYGTFPTAPMVFVLSAHYDVEIESVPSALVVCTFLSAPLMYISAKMIFLRFSPSDDYSQRLGSFAFNVGILGIPLGVWLLILFIANKAFNKVPHKITGFLFISQVIICLGVSLQPLIESNKPWSGYIQFFILTFGIYSSRIWTCLLAVILVMLQTRSLCFVIKLMPGFVILAWGVSAILVMAECFSSISVFKFDAVINPDFENGKLHCIVTLLLLILSLTGTSICLILQHRYQRLYDNYLNLVQEVNSKDLQEVNEANVGGSCSVNIEQNHDRNCTTLSDIEEIVNENTSDFCNGNCNDEGLCSSKFRCTDIQREICEQTIKQYNIETVNENIDEDHQDRQILRHLILLVLLVTSMFVNLMLSIWTMVVEDAISGIYVELQFLNVMLNIGQIFFTFAVFGFDSRGLVASITNRWRKFYYGADNIVLTPVEELGFETTHVCHQFIAHHLHNCEKEIAKNKRLRLRLYKNCFKGKVLVSWLQAKRLAKDEVEAVQYASHLLEGRVLRHIENRHHFENSDLLYTFRQ